MRGCLPWPRDRVAHAGLKALVATIFYTGARSEEVRGLTVKEIDWKRDEIILRYNGWRGLKRVHSTRRVPMPPDLRTILTRYLQQTGITAGLLFVGGSKKMLGALQTIFPRALALAQITGDVTPQSLRHTYATAMLHTYLTMPDGRAVQRSSHNVAKLLRHKISKLVDETYGHLLWDAGMMHELSLDHLRRFPAAGKR